MDPIYLYFSPLLLQYYLSNSSVETCYLFFCLLLSAVIVHQVHQLGHEGFNFSFITKMWRRAHAGHHTSSYPFEDQAYQINKDDPYFLNTYAYLISLLIFNLITYHWHTSMSLNIYLINVIVWLLIENEVHHSCHDLSHWIRIWHNSKWYQHILLAHRYHHDYRLSKGRYNYAIVSLWVDRLLGTYYLPKKGRI